MEIGFKNWNRCRMSGLGLLKTVPGLCEMGHKCLCVLVCIGPGMVVDCWFTR